MAFGNSSSTQFPLASFKDAINECSALVAEGSTESLIDYIISELVHLLPNLPSKMSYILILTVSGREDHLLEL